MLFVLPLPPLAIPTKLFEDPPLLLTNRKFEKMPPLLICFHCGLVVHVYSSEPSQIGEPGVNGSPAMNSALFVIVSKLSADFAVWYMKNPTIETT